MNDRWNKVSHYHKLNKYLQTIQIHYITVLEVKGLNSVHRACETVLLLEPLGRIPSLPFTDVRYSLHSLFHDPYLYLENQKLSIFFSLWLLFPSLHLLSLTVVPLPLFYNYIGLKQITFHWSSHLTSLNLITAAKFLESHKASETRTFEDSNSVCYT
jgi:hypothetical protein